MRSKSRNVWEGCSSSKCCSNKQARTLSEVLHRLLSFSSPDLQLLPSPSHQLRVSVLPWKQPHVLLHLRSSFRLQLSYSPRSWLALPIPGSANSPCSALQHSSVFSQKMSLLGPVQVLGCQHSPWLMEGLLSGSSTQQVLKLGSPHEEIQTEDVFCTEVNAIWLLWLYWLQAETELRDIFLWPNVYRRNHHFWCVICFQAWIRN